MASVNELIQNQKEEREKHLEVNKQIRKKIQDAIEEYKKKEGNYHG